MSFDSEYLGGRGSNKDIPFCRPPAWWLMATCWVEGSWFVHLLKVVEKSPRTWKAQTCDLFCGGNVGRKQYWTILVDVSEEMPALPTVLITEFWLSQAFTFIIRKQGLVTVTYYFNSIGNMSSEMPALSCNFCVEISLQMNYFRKNRIILTMFWPIWSANPESAMEMMLSCLHWRKLRPQLNFFQWMESSA